MTAILYRYLLIVIACVAMLIGLQIPNFVDQYEKRVDAHLREVSMNLQPFQEIADKHFGGDMGKLLELHRNSTEKPFQEEGKAIEQMMQRKLRFATELAALNASLPLKAWHVAFRSDQEMLDEAFAQYSYAVPLNQDAVAFGGGAALFILLLVELLFALARLAGKKLFHTIRPTTPSKAQ